MSMICNQRQSPVNRSSKVEVKTTLPSKSRLKPLVPTGKLYTASTNRATRIAHLLMILHTQSHTRPIFCTSSSRLPYNLIVFLSPDVLTSASASFLFYRLWYIPMIDIPSTKKQQGPKKWYESKGYTDRKEAKGRSYWYWG